MTQRQYEMKRAKILEELRWVAWTNNLSTKRGHDAFMKAAKEADRKLIELEVEFKTSRSRAEVKR